MLFPVGWHAVCSVSHCFFISSTAVGFGYCSRRPELTSQECPQGISSAAEFTCQLAAYQPLEPPQNHLRSFLVRQQQGQKSVKVAPGQPPYSSPSRTMTEQRSLSSTSHTFHRPSTTTTDACSLPKRCTAKEFIIAKPKQSQMT